MAIYFKWTPEATERLRQLAPNFLAREIADELGCSEGSVTARMRGEKIPGINRSDAYRRAHLNPRTGKAKVSGRIDAQLQQRKALRLTAAQLDASNAAKKLALLERIAFLKRWQSRMAA